MYPLPPEPTPSMAEALWKTRVWDPVVKYFIASGPWLPAEAPKKGIS